MQISTTYNNYSSKVNEFKNNINFTGSEKALAAVDNVVAPKTIKLVKRADEFIEETWAEIRAKKHKSKITIPAFRTRDKEVEVLLKPLYNTLKSSILFEARGPKYVDRIIIERQNPNNFRYEKAILTPTGSATIKMYDSRNERNQEIVDKVDNLVAKYFPKILPKVTFKESMIS